MAAGDTITQSLADSLPTVVASARQTREFEGVMPNLVDKVTLSEGTGTSWREVTMAQLTAQTVTETTRLDNPQQMSDTLLTITPTVVAIQTLITDRVASRISSTAYAKVGNLAQNAIQRKKDEDGLTVLDGATNVLAGTGTTLTSGHILLRVTVLPAMPLSRAMSLSEPSCTGSRSRTCSTRSQPVLVLTICKKGQPLVSLERNTKA